MKRRVMKIDSNSDKETMRVSSSTAFAKELKTDQKTR
jgi:hypothetical protein